MAHQRNLELDCAKGLAISLVVLGHLAPGGPLPGAEWYEVLKKVLYTFHIPFFMWISGFVAYYSYTKIDSIDEYVNYLKTKSVRLLPGFLLILFIVLTGKLLLQDYMVVDNKISSWEALLRPILIPQQSYIRFIWYIYVLFEFYTILPLLILMTRGRLEWTLPFAVLVHFWTPTPLFALDLVCRFALFFLFGCVTVIYWEIFNSAVKKYGVYFLLFFISLLLLNMSYPIGKLLTGTISIPALYWLISLKVVSVNAVFEYVGRFTYPIYLFSMLSIGVAKGVFITGFGLGYEDYFYLAPIFLIIGLLIPIILKITIINRIPVLDKITN